jgi:hypothetical protein
LIDDEVVHDTHYVEQVIRTDVLATVMGIDDLNRPPNINVDRDYDIHLFDFDQAFQRKRHSMLGLVRDSQALKDMDVGAIVEDEKRLIARRASKEALRVRYLIDVMKQTEFGQSQAKRISHDLRDMGQYVEEQLNRCGDWERIIDIHQGTQ